MMRISELVAALESIQAQHGDLDVYGCYDQLTIEVDADSLIVAPRARWGDLAEGHPVLWLAVGELPTDPEPQD